MTQIIRHDNGITVSVYVRYYEMIGKEKFEPAEVSDKDRINAIEEAIMELTEMLGGKLQQQKNNLQRK